MLDLIFCHSAYSLIPSLFSHTFPSFFPFSVHCRQWKSPRDAGPSTTPTRTDKLDNIYYYLHCTSAYKAQLGPGIFYVSLYRRAAEASSSCEALAAWMGMARRGRESSKSHSRWVSGTDSGCLSSQSCAPPIRSISFSRGRHDGCLRPTRNK